MARHKSQKPKDRKNVSNRVFGRYAFRDGQMHSIQGMTNFQVDTAESQVFGFYSNTGQGATEGGPGTGKALLYTPGMSTEVLGTGLKTRSAGDNTELPAKIIRCHNGDVIVRQNSQNRYQFAAGGFNPLLDNQYDLGNSSYRWRNLYTGDLNLSNKGSQNDVDGSWGNYTIQEGESDLFLINNRSGKKYKFNLTEVS